MSTKTLSRTVIEGDELGLAARRLRSQAGRSLSKVRVHQGFGLHRGRATVVVDAHNIVRVQQRRRKYASPGGS